MTAKRLVRTLAAACVVVTALAGCAAQTQPAAPRPQATVNTPAPRCYDATECERMWLSAQQRVESLTGMRLRMVNDSRIESFAPTGYGRTGAVVLKYPMGDGSYELRAEFECYRYTDCSNLRPLAINAFNSSVALSGNVGNASKAAPRP